MMPCTMIDLAEMVDNAGPNGISKNIDGCAESVGKYYFRNQSIYLYIYIAPIIITMIEIVLIMYMNTLLYYSRNQSIYL